MPNLFFAVFLALLSSRPAPFNSWRVDLDVAPARSVKTRGTPAIYEIM